MREGGRSGEGWHLWHVAGIDYQYVRVIPQRFFGIEHVWLDQRFRAPITDRERTVLDLFAMPRLFGGIDEGLSVLDRFLSQLDLARLVHYAQQYGVVAVSRRLGWCLERVGAEPEALRPLRELPSPHYSPLDPGRPRRGPHDKHWMIIVNTGRTASPR